MTESTEDPELQVRPTGSMVTYGYPRDHLQKDLAIAAWLNARRVEILPDWTARPDPGPAQKICDDAGIVVHSVHACWGGVSPFAVRVDLGSTSSAIRFASLDAVKYCLDWAVKVGATHLVVHPGGLSDRSEQDARTSALLESLEVLADAVGDAEIRICVENMPPGVFPGHRMNDLRQIVDQMDRPQIGLALDTGHAHISSTIQMETLAAGCRLFTTHVHDNNGRNDAHLPPGRGTLNWEAWPEALNEIGYQGTIMLECIRFLREHPESLTDELRKRIQLMTGP